ncbi:MAG: helix-turn-helix domain-containing protein [Syntrophobacteraceae bacterium]
MEGEWFVTVSCAAEELECGRASIYNLVERGLLCFVRMPGREIRISVESIRGLKESDWFEAVKQRMRS